MFDDGKNMIGLEREGNEVNFELGESLFRLDIDDDNDISPKLKFELKKEKEERRKPPPNKLETDWLKF